MTINKKFIAIAFLGLFSLAILVLVPNFTYSADKPYCGTLTPTQRTGGLIPCGRDCNDPTTTNDETAACGFCHIFVLFNNIINFLFRLVPPIAALMLVYAGVKFFLAIDNPGEVGKAKDLIKSVIIGLIIIYGAWAFVGTFLSAIGLATWTEDIFRSWWTQGLFQLNCSTP